MKNYAEIWGEKAKELLLNKRITHVRYTTSEEASEMGWYERVIIFKTEDDVWFYPSRDDEGNGGGALFTTHDEHSVLPVIPKDLS